MNNINRNIQELTWQDARKEVFSVASQLSHIIDDLNPDNTYTFFKVKYAFGDEILKNGLFYLPDDTGKLVNINDISYPHIKKKLSYNMRSNPVTLILNNSLELFLELDDRIIPLYGLLEKGVLFGLWRVLAPQISQHPAFLWNLTAGARSLCMLPKISNNTLHTQLKKQLHIQENKPNTLLDHWKIFKAIAKNHDYVKPWHTDVLFFSNKWFNHLHNKAWANFYRYMLESTWKTSEFRRNEFIWNLFFSVANKGRKNDPYVLDTVKQLFYIASGYLPGFYPATDNSVAPIDDLQKIYIECYGLKNYAPTIIQPQYLFLNSKQTVYYALNFPTIMESLPKSIANSSRVTDLDNIKYLMRQYLKRIGNGEFNLSDVKTFAKISKLKFDYFHDSPSIAGYSDIRKTNDISMLDADFLIRGKYCNNKQFPENSIFTRSCIRISKR